VRENERENEREKERESGLFPGRSKKWESHLWDIIKKRREMRSFTSIPRKGGGGGLGREGESFQ